MRTPPKLGDKKLGRGSILLLAHLEFQLDAFHSSPQARISPEFIAPLIIYGSGKIASQRPPLLMTMIPCFRTSTKSWTWPHNEALEVGLIRYSRTYAYKTVKSLGFQKNKYAMNSFQWKYSPTQSHRRQEGKAIYSSFVRHHKALVQVVVKLGGLLLGIFIHYALPWQPFESIFSLLCGASSTQLPDEPTFQPQDKIICGSRTIS